MWMMLNPPVEHLELVAQFGLTHHLILTHLLESSKKYKRFYKRLSKQGHWLTLDNSVMEVGEPIVNVDLIRELNVSEVVAPDYLFDATKTLDETRKYIQHVRQEFPQIEIMGVPQGNNASEYFQCLASMYENPHITTIGIGKTATSHLYRLEGFPEFLRPLFGRLSVLSFICEEFSRSKPVHILGLVLPEVEIPLYRHLSFIRSFDSSFPFRYFSSKLLTTSTEFEGVLDSSVLRECMKWIEQILSMTKVEP